MSRVICLSFGSSAKAGLLFVHHLRPGLRALNLRRLFAHQLKHSGHYRVRIQASNGDQKSAVRTVSFTVR